MTLYSRDLIEALTIAKRHADNSGCFLPEERAKVTAVYETFVSTDPAKTAKLTPTQLADAIILKKREIDLKDGEINAIAKQHIPDFHFLDHKVSTFWRCKTSPIGVCVFNKVNGEFHLNCTCRYCGDPVERK